MAQVDDLLVSLRGGSLDVYFGVCFHERMTQGKSLVRVWSERSEPDPSREDFGLARFEGFLLAGTSGKPYEIAAWKPKMQPFICYSFFRRGGEWQGTFYVLQEKGEWLAGDWPAR